MYTISILKANRGPLQRRNVYFDLVIVQLVGYQNLRVSPQLKLANFPIDKPCIRHWDKRWLVRVSQNVLCLATSAANLLRKRTDKGIRRLSTTVHIRCAYLVVDCERIIFGRVAVFWAWIISIAAVAFWFRVRPAAYYAASLQALFALFSGRNELICTD